MRVQSSPDAITQGWVRGLLLALFVSNAGTALQITAQAWFVWELTRSPSHLGLLGLAQASPLLGMPLLGGVLADRWARRSILMATQSVLAALSALMGVLALAGTLSLGLLLFMAALLAAVAALDNPVRQVYLPGVVADRERGRTIGLNALAYNAGAVAGPAVAGVLLPLAGAGWCFLLNSVSYLLVLAWLLPGPEGRTVPGASIATGRGLRNGVYVFRSSHALSLLALVAVVSLLGRSYPHVLPVVVSQMWGGGAGAYGALAALPGIGAVVAAGLIAGLLGRQVGRRRDRTILTGWRSSAVLLGCALAGLGVAPQLFLAGAALAAIGFAATGTMTLLNVELQQTTPNAVRGRVLSLYTVLAAGMPALGGWLLGTLIGFVGSGMALVLAGVALIFMVWLTEVAFGLAYLSGVHTP